MRNGATAVHSPADLREALRLLAELGDAARPLAGGTDAMVKLKDGLWQPEQWVNLLRLRPELAFIRRDNGWVEVGALTTFSELLGSSLARQTAPLLVQAARTVGGPAIRNMGTLGGNLGTASPAGDTLPALYALEARLRLVSLEGERELAIADVFTGPGRTVLKPGELIHSVRFAAQQSDELCTFEKLGLRAAHAISVASVGLRLVPGASGFKQARVALGAVAPTVIRVPEAEAALLSNAPLTAAAAQKAAAACRDAARPIDDVRATGSYRRAMAGNLLLRGLIRLLGPELLPAALGGD